MVLSVVLLLVVGLVVGALARLVVPGPQTLPVWLTMVIGAGCSLLAGLVVPGTRSRVLEVVLAVVLSAAVIALTEGRARQRTTLR